MPIHPPRTAYGEGKQAGYPYWRQGSERAARVVMERVAVVAGVTAEATTTAEETAEEASTTAEVGAALAEAKAVVRVRTGAESSRGQSRVLGVNDFVHSMHRWSK